MKTVSGMAMIYIKRNLILLLAVVPLTVAAIADGDVSDFGKSLPNVLGISGKTIFRHSNELATIRCAPLRLCVMILEPQELVNSVNIADSKRWVIEPTYTGTKENGTTHILIKPLEEDLATSLVVATDRRTYHISLESTSEEYMPLVSFTYPDSEQQSWQRYIADQQTTARRSEEKASLAKTKKIEKRLVSIDSKYDLDGKANWKPQLVYNDGEKTYIQFNEELVGDELPILLVLSEEGEELQVNYRMIGRTMKVDYLIREALLVSGVGDYQERITLQYKGV